MVIYGGGFGAVQLVLMLLYLRALSLRGVMRLDAAYELSLTREEIQGFLLKVSVALVSVAWAVCGCPESVSWTGMGCLLVFRSRLSAVGR
jgi:hypothetical protein